jgi:hypothetical protein
MSKLNAHDLADELIRAVTISVQNTPNWVLLKRTIGQMWSKYESLELKRLMFLTKRPGGSKKGKKMIKRNFEAAFNTLLSTQCILRDFSEGASGFQNKYLRKYTTHV